MVFILASVVPAFSTVLENGAVYAIHNSGKGTVSMGVAGSGSNAVTTATNNTDPKQQWYVTGSESTGYYLRNVATGGYLSSPNTTSAQWTVQIVPTPADATMLMAVADLNNVQTIHVKKDTFGYGYAHSDASNNVVGWTTSNANTQWIFENLNFTQDQIAGVLDNFRKTSDEIARAGEYETHLDNLFTDKSCTVLREGIDLAGSADFNALPSTLQAMVAKVQGKDWSETCRFGGKDYDWESPYAEKYRVQLYEPYSEGSNAASMAGIQAYTNMNNPTGILGDAGDLIYVMVEDEPQAGSSLYIYGIADTGYYNSVTAGTRLHKGLNIISCLQDNSHYFIYYSVETAKNQVHTDYKVTEFPDIKIHIEGGRINGFFNYIGDELYAKDTREDFLYTAMRATHPMYDFVGKYVILHLHLEDTPSQDGQENQKCVKSSLITNPTAGDDRTQNPVAIMKSWDNMCFAERILMGIMSDDDIEDAYNRGYYETIVGENYSVTEGTTVYSTDPGFHYCDYFNNKMMGVSQQGTLFMNATSWRTAYNVSTIDAILTLFPSGNIWGPAHEYGHMNQPPMNMAGTTEESNNIFSNVAMYYAGLYASRAELPSAQMKNFADSKTYLDAGTWGTTRMFWQLWCYYHATGHNKKFYPRLYELLRHHPLKKTVASAGDHNERYDMLHFAKMCCIAAGEDLTNFFKVWGFFVPLDNYKIDDYSVYNAVLSQSDIDAVLAEIKAFEFPKNDAIILIDDRVGCTDRASYPGFPIEQAGTLGGLKDFQQGNGSNPSGNYSFNINGNDITIETDGDKGVGYLIYDNDGNIIAFANTDSFEVSDEVAAKLRDGSASIQVAGEQENSTLTVTNTLRDGSSRQKRLLLSDIVEKCNALLAFVDKSETKVGYLHYEKSKNLEQMKNDAQALIDGESEDGDALTSMLLSLSDNYSSLLTDDKAYIGIEEGAAYRLTNNSLTTRVLCEKQDNNYKTTPQTVASIAASAYLTAEKDPFTQQWIFESIDSDGSYALRNAGTGRYLNIVDGYKANTILPMSPTAHEYTKGLIADRTGVFYLAPDGRTASALHMNNSGNIYHYTTTSPNSQWTITKINSADYMAQLDELKYQIEEAESLLAQAGDIMVDPLERMPLTAECLDGNSKQPSGNGAFTSWKVLVDDNPTTYFASNRNTGESTDGLDHYIKITAPGDETFRYFTLTYTVNSFQSNATNIRSYRVEASINGKDWAPVFEDNANLNISYSSVNSSELIAVPEGTKYVRFVVTKSDEQKAFHYTFLLAEIAISNASEATYYPYEKFTRVAPSDMEDLHRRITEAKFVTLNPASSADDLSANLNALANSYDNLAEKMSLSTSVDAMDADADSSDEYYLINGLRVTRPDRGIYIHRHGNKTIKEHKN